MFKHISRSLKIKENKNSFFNMWFWMRSRRISNDSINKVVFEPLHIYNFDKKRRRRTKDEKENIKLIE